MLGLLPEELLDLILEFADPSWAHNLCLVSNGFHRHVWSFYKENAHKLLRPGGGWNASIRSKRTRTSLENTTQCISYAPMGLHSILHQKCAGCKKKFMASVNKDFGIIAHPDCIRNYLINTYYFQKFGLTDQHFSAVPQSELAGYSHGSYGRGAYCYMVVWKDKTHGIVPYEWTAHYLFHGPCREYVRHFLAEKQRKEREAMERRQAQKEEAQRQRNEAQKHIRKAYRERMTALVEDMKPILTAKQVRNVLRTKLPERFNPHFFKMRDVPPHFFTPECYKNAAEVVSHLHRLLKHLNVSDISYLNYHDLEKSFETLCRTKVQYVLSGMVEKIHQSFVLPSTIQCGCGRSASTHCADRKCRVCCPGCRHHRIRS